jgi:hypothetical protein
MSGGVNRIRGMQCTVQIPLHTGMALYRTERRPLIRAGSRIAGESLADNLQAGFAAEFVGADPKRTQRFFRCGQTWANAEMHEERKLE